MVPSVAPIEACVALPTRAAVGRAIKAAHEKAASPRAKNDESGEGELQRAGGSSYSGRVARAAGGGTGQ